MKRIFKIGTLIGIYGFLICVLLQIFARFFLANTPPWTEEAARLFFIYAVSFSAGLALKSKYYVALDFLSDKVLIFVDLVVLLFFLLMTFYAVRFTLVGIGEKSPTMNIRMALGFTSMIVLNASIAYYSFISLKGRRI
jgi:TRAP-type C4-dicarboxylate transport system permease small subunit